MKLKIGIFFDGTSYNANNNASEGLLNINLEASSIFSGYAKATETLAESLFNEQVSSNCKIPNSYQYNIKSERSSYNSNIWELYSIYSKGFTTEGYQLGVYVNGCGTEDNQVNDLFTMATGWSFPFSGVNCGVFDKTNLAINLINKELDEILFSNNLEFETIEFELFGFSRGCASARHFANRVVNKDIKLRELFNKHFTVNNYHQINEKACGKIAFIGVFDTVAAILALSNFDWDISSGNTGNVNLQLGSGIADNIFHITAGHELKSNFSLNRTLPHYISELELPGCHVDIGGGHPDQVEEGLFISKPFYSIEFNIKGENESSAYKQAHQEYNSLLQHPRWGEILKISDVKIVSWRKELLFDSYIYGSGVMLRRYQVNNGLEKIALHAMHQYASMKGCQFSVLNETDIPNKLLNFYRNVTTEVKRIAKQQQSLSMMNDLAPAIAKEYVHCEFFWSTVPNDNDLAPTGIDITAPEWLDVLLINRPAINLERSIYDSYGKKL